MENTLLTIAEAAALLKVELPTVQALVGNGELRTFKEGSFLRVYKDSVLEYLDGDGQKPLAENATAQPYATQNKNPDALPPEKVVGDLKTSVKANKRQDVDDEAVVRQKRKELAEHKALAEIEIETIAIDIKTQEARKERDLPGILKARNEELNKRAVELKARETELIAGEKKLADDKISYDKFCAETNGYCEKQRKEADSYAEAKKKEGDDYFNKMKSDASSAEAVCKTTAESVKVLQEKTAAAQKQLDDIAVQAKNYTHQVEAHAQSHYFQARATQGAVSTWHDEQANKGWDLTKTLDDLYKQLMAYLR